MKPANGKSFKPETDIILAAEFVLTPKEHWTKGNDARNGDGLGVARNKPEACMFCLTGAMRLAAEDLGAFHREFYRSALSIVEGVVHGIVWQFNDYDATHIGVLRALRRAAVLSEYGA